MKAKLLSVLLYYLLKSPPPDPTTPAAAAQHSSSSSSAVLLLLLKRAGMIIAAVLVIITFLPPYLADDTAAHDFFCPPDFEIERHKESLHGDICRSVKSFHFVCPQSLCDATPGGEAPYCVMQRRRFRSSTTTAMEPCRVPRPERTLEEPRCPEGFTMERHDHEPRHGDVCRAGDGSGHIECPLEVCTRSSDGAAPWCEDSAGATKPCRAPREPGELPYLCDPGGGERGVCILATGAFAGKGTHTDVTCNGECGAETAMTNPSSSPAGGCRSDCKVTPIPNPLMNLTHAHTTIASLAQKGTALWPACARRRVSATAIIGPAAPTVATSTSSPSTSSASATPRYATPLGAAQCWRWREEPGTSSSSGSGLWLHPKSLAR